MLFSISAISIYRVYSSGGGNPRPRIIRIGSTSSTSSTESTLLSEQIVLDLSILCSIYAHTYICLFSYMTKEEMIILKIDPLETRTIEYSALTN